MPYLPPEIIALLLGLGGFCGLMLMVGIRVTMRRDLEPMSRQGRGILLACLAALALGVIVLYYLVRHVLDI